jgi:pimeloyl-ACP methyl ester carboxylesterase
MSANPSDVMPVQSRMVDGISIRYAESDGRQDQSVLLTSPWPESLYAFWPIWRALASHAHLIAIDLPGFGGSERRDTLLSPQTMGAFLIRLVDEWGLDRPHVVGPDVGTTASPFAAALHPDKLRSLVVGGGATAYPLQVGGGLKEIIEAPILEAFRTTDPRILVGHALDAGHERYKLPGEVREDYLQSYQGDRFVESMRYVRRYPEDLPLLRERLAEIHTPVQIISGRRDGLVPPINAEDLHQRLPNSKLDILDVGHFVWEDAADQYAALIVSWIEGGYQNAGA